ncbi:hypothetical protein F0A16_13165 [Salinicola corii]|uniref:Alpha/beta hydrolase n=1 Tax=Salinicola corii TaxID=2606937 RepID=A0A640WCG5_9GAMM|nr:hypothetical protein [Salinicola corii]KAA0017497.1 hypothetical protein F0A16_13165 [Salinicola corii]
MNFLKNIRRLAAFDYQGVHTKRIAEGEYYRITLHDIGSDKTVISFAFLGAGVSDKGSDRDFCLKNGYNNIYVSCSDEDRFQSLSIEIFESAVTPYIRDKQVISYGTSVGAYAAIYFGGGINARIVAFSPRNSFHPIFNWQSKKFKHCYLRDTVCSSITPTIIYDPFEKTDHRYVTECIMPAYRKLNVVTLDNCGHTTSLALSQAGLLKGFVLKAFQGVIEVPELPNLQKVWYLTKKVESLIQTGQAAKRYLIPLLELSQDSEIIKLAAQYNLNSGDNVPIPRPSQNRIRASLQKLNGRCSDKPIGTVLLDIATRLENVGAYRESIEILSLALITKGADEKLSKRMQNLKKLAATQV